MGKRLICVAAHRHGEPATVIVLLGGRTLEDWLRAGGLTCDARWVALAARQRRGRWKPCAAQVMLW